MPVNWVIDPDASLGTNGDPDLTLTQVDILYGALLRGDDA